MTSHMVLQGKGGIGKSFVASLIAQYRQDRGHHPTCVDAHPVDATRMRVAIDLRDTTTPYADLRDDKAADQ